MADNSLNNKSSSEITYFIEKTGDTDNPPFIVVKDTVELSQVPNPSDDDIAVIWNPQDPMTAPRIAIYQGNRWEVQNLVGKDGKNGIDGRDGTDGINGTDGTNGQQGQRGNDGNDGLPPDHSWTGTSLRFRKPDGSWGELVNLKGNTGDKGVKGDTGAQGEAPQHNWSGTSLRFRNSDGSWGAYVNLKGADGQNGQNGQDGQDGQNGQPPEHQVLNNMVRFRNPDGAWGTWITFGGVTELKFSEYSLTGVVQVSSRRGVVIETNFEDGTMELSSNLRAQQGVYLDEEDFTIRQEITTAGSGEVVTNIQPTDRGFEVTYGDGSGWDGEGVGRIGIDTETPNYVAGDVLFGRRAGLNIHLNPTTKLIEYELALGAGNGLTMNADKTSISLPIEMVGEGNAIVAVEVTAGGLRFTKGTVGGGGGEDDPRKSELAEFNTSSNTIDISSSNPNNAHRRIYYSGASEGVLAIMDENPVIGDTLVVQGTKIGLRLRDAVGSKPLLTPESIEAVTDYNPTITGGGTKMLAKLRFTDKGYILESYTVF